jgi:tripartite-type tricarboxylate transporter receptor subunit TctC
MKVLRGAAAFLTALLCALPACGLAQDSYPSKPIHLLVGFQPGSTSDVAARIVAQKLGQVIGQAVLVENRAGASSSIAARAVSASAPDGYTLFYATVANVINTAARGPAEVDISRDLSPVALIGSVPNILVLNPALGVDTLEDFIKLAKSKPGELPYATAGNGTALHMAAALFSMMADVKMLHVPYQGSNAAMADLLSGRTALMFGPISTVMPHIKSGKLKAIASTGLRRSALVPDLPTLSELGLKDFESTVWSGIMAPPGLPPKVEAALASAVQAAVNSPEVQAQFKAQGIDSSLLLQKEFATYIRSETDKWTRVIQTSGIKLN